MHHHLFFLYFQKALLDQFEHERQVSNTVKMAANASTLLNFRHQAVITQYVAVVLSKLMKTSINQEQDINTFQT